MKFKVGALNASVVFSIAKTSSFNIHFVRALAFLLSSFPRENDISVSIGKFSK